MIEMPDVCKAREVKKSVEQFQGAVSLNFHYD